MELKTRNRERRWSLRLRLRLRLLSYPNTKILLSRCCLFVYHETHRCFSAKCFTMFFCAESLKTVKDKSKRYGGRTVHCHVVRFWIARHLTDSWLNIFDWLYETIFQVDLRRPAGVEGSSQMVACPLVVNGVELVSSRF